MKNRSRKVEKQTWVKFEAEDALRAVEDAQAEAYDLWLAEEERRIEERRIEEEMRRMLEDRDDRYYDRYYSDEIAESWEICDPAF